MIIQHFTTELTANSRSLQLNCKKSENVVKKAPTKNMIAYLQHGAARCKDKE